MERTKAVVIAGPTASGKSALAVELAALFDGEIINADSMQVYRGMDIGTAKPDAVARAKAPHHLIDIVDPDEDYSAARFRADAAEKIAWIHARGKSVFIVGGTGLYIKALTRGLFEGPGADSAVRAALAREAAELGAPALYERLRSVDPQIASGIHPNNLRRVMRALEVYELAKRPLSELQREHAFSEEPYETLKIGLDKGRAALCEDIDRRVDAMVTGGLVEETRRLIEAGYSAAAKPMGALGYKEMALYLSGSVPLAEAVSLLKRNTRSYAKRQMTWFRKDPEIRWFNPAQKSDIITVIKEFL